MMEHFVTLFNSLFLPQGLALHASMERHLEQYMLWVLCLDNTTQDVLSKLDLPNMKLLPLDQFETEELRSVKKDRTTGEYCWTLTPFTPRFVFEVDANIDRVTYLDADLWFRKNPAPIFREFDASGKHVLITDHGFAPEYDYSATKGQYCVQFMTFTRRGGETVRKWWEDKCIEWCFSRFEDGKFGDQKYLDDWPELFPEHVHVLADKELALAPWNATRFPYGNGVFWHFHGLRILSCNGQSAGVEFGNYPLPRKTREHVYKPYLLDLRQAVEDMSRCGVMVKAQTNRTFRKRVIAQIRGIYHQAWRINHSLISRF